jgi:hypothetical protein
MPHTPLLLLCLLLQKQPAANKQSPQEQIKKPTAEQSAPNINQPVGSNESQTRNDDHKEDERTQRVKEINDRLLVIFTGVLALVGILQFVAIARQEKWMRENVEVSQDNARTAEASADALKHIYRPWILFRWELRGRIAGAFIFSIKNWGQTPALVECCFFAPKVMTLEELTNLPVETDYKGPLRHPHMLAPSESFELPNGYCEPDSGGSWNEVYRGTKRLVWSGVVRYRDILNPDILHETRFCYWYAPNHGHPQVGASEQNTAT